MCFLFFRCFHCYLFVVLLVLVRLLVVVVVVAVAVAVVVVVVVVVLVVVVVVVAAAIRWLLRLVLGVVLRSLWVPGLRSWGHLGCWCSTGFIVLGHKGLRVQSSRNTSRVWGFRV